MVVDRDMTGLNIKVARVLVVLAAVAAVVQSFILSPNIIDNVINIGSAGGDWALVQHIEDGEIVFDQVGANGVRMDGFTIKQNSNDQISKVLDFSVNSDNIVCLIREYSDLYTGEFIKQELEVYDLDKFISKKVATLPLENEDAIRYRWVSTSGVTVLMGTNPTGDTLVRNAYETQSLIDVQNPSSRSYRQYYVDPNEGIYDVAIASEDIAFATMSGKVFSAEEEEEAVEIYPARALTQLMYPMFISPLDTSSVIIGEQISGDVSSLDIIDGDTSVLLNSGAQFTGISDYSPKDLLLASFVDEDNFAGVTKSIQTEGYAVVITENGISSAIERITLGPITFTSEIIINFVIYSVAIVGIYWAITRIIHFVRTSRTLLLKLVFSSIPMLVIAFALFGFFSYNSYSQSIEENFNKQVEDEGNLLTALFGSGGFETIEFPYDYNSEDYRYQLRQLDTREVYTRTGYYEDNELYIGIDRGRPLFYPFELVGNSTLTALYREAALTGSSQTGIIEDENGRRITSVTPIGGSSGDVVYLMETGIDIVHMNRYNQTFIGQYLIISMAFILLISTLLIFGFRRVLKPLEEIKNGLEEFSTGNRKIRLETETDDEFSDITKVFNKMANDIDTQLYSLKNLSATYYRFVPQRVFKLLGKERLGDIKLGDYTQGRYNVLYIKLRLNSDTLTPMEDKIISDRFFNIVNESCINYKGTMLVDRINLHDLKIICSEDQDSGVAMALAALAQIDSYNASALIQNRMEALFVLYRTDLLYGISGDENRYIPTMVSSGIKDLENEIENIRQFSARLIVTQEAYETLDNSRYYHRGIGCAENRDLGNLYDFYDSSTPEVIRLINNTKNTFDKAMELYNQGRYYDAKNLFALVIRENHHDNVARSYIFKCEKKLSHQSIK